eukprot:363169-Chlamydomonas_euryale.AAC.55
MAVVCQSVCLIAHVAATEPHSAFAMLTGQPERHAPRAGAVPAGVPGPRARVWRAGVVAARAVAAVPPGARNAAGGPRGSHGGVN